VLEAPHPPPERMHPAKSACVCWELDESHGKCTGKEKTEHQDPQLERAGHPVPRELESELLRVVHKEHDDDDDGQNPQHDGKIPHAGVIPSLHASYNPFAPHPASPGGSPAQTVTPSCSVKITVEFWQNLNI